MAETVHKDRVADAITAGMSGLLPAVSAVIGEAPTAKKDHGKYSDRAARTAESLVSALTQSVRRVIRRDEMLTALIEKWKEESEDDDSPYGIVVDIVLGVFTYKGIGVLVTQSRYTPESERLPADEAFELAKEVIFSGERGAFKTDYNDEEPGRCGKYGIDRYWLGPRSEEECEQAYRSGKDAEGAMARIYKLIESVKDKDGKSSKRKTARYVERIASWESDGATVADMIDDASDYANSRGQSADFEEFEEDVEGLEEELEADEPEYPTNKTDFTKWAKERNLKKSDLTAAKKAINVNKYLDEMSEDELAMVCQKLEQLAAA